MNTKLRRVESFLLSKNNQIIDLQDVAYKLILDVLFQWAFGIEVDQFRDDEENDIGLNGTNNNNMSQVIDAFDKLQLYTHQRFADFFWEIKQKYCLGERERNVKICTQIMDDFCYELIEQARTQQQEQQQQQNDDDINSYRREDIISRFLRYAEKEGTPCTDKELRDFCMLFLLAGRDTTSASLCWCVYELTRHPAWICNLREEIATICGTDDDNAEKFTYEAIQQMKVVHAIVHETLRLHSPAPDNYRFAVNDDILPDGTQIPAGSLVMFSPYTINHSEKVWGENPDEFDPSRWIDTGEPSPSRSPTFGAGPRQCPGRTLGLMEIKMALAFLVSKFDFVDEAGHDGDYSWTLVMSMKGGFPVRVKSLNKK